MVTEVPPLLPQRSALLIIGYRSAVNTNVHMLRANGVNTSYSVQVQGRIQADDFFLGGERVTKPNIVKETCFYKENRQKLGVFGGNSRVCPPAGSTSVQV